MASSTNFRIKYENQVDVKISSDSAAYDINIEDFREAYGFEMCVNFMHSSKNFEYLFIALIFPNRNYLEIEPTITRHRDLINDRDYDYLFCTVSIIDVEGNSRFPQYFNSTDSSEMTYLKKSFILNRAEELLSDGVLTLRIDFLFESGNLAPYYSDYALSWQFRTFECYESNFLQLLNNAEVSLNVAEGGKLGNSKGSTIQDCRNVNQAKTEPVSLNENEVGEFGNSEYSTMQDCCNKSLDKTGTVSLYEKEDGDLGNSKRYTTQDCGIINQTKTGPVSLNENEDGNLRNSECSTMKDCRNKNLDKTGTVSLKEKEVGDFRNSECSTMKDCRNKNLDKTGTVSLNEKEDGDFRNSKCFTMKDCRNVYQAKTGSVSLNENGGGYLGNSEGSTEQDCRNKNLGKTGTVSLNEKEDGGLENSECSTMQDCRNMNQAKTLSQNAIPPKDGNGVWKVFDAERLVLNLPQFHEARRRFGVYGIPPVSSWHCPDLEELDTDIYEYIWIFDCENERYLLLPDIREESLWIKLLRASPVIRRMVMSPMREQQERHIVFTNRCKFSLVLAFLDLGKLITSNLDEVVDVYRFSHMYQMEELQRKCAEFMVQSLENESELEDLERIAGLYPNLLSDLLKERRNEIENLNLLVLKKDDIPYSDCYN